MSADPSDTAGAAEAWKPFHFHFPASPNVTNPRPTDPGPDPRRPAITAKVYADLLLRMLPNANLGMTRPRIYTASRDEPSLKNHADCVSAVDAWMRKFDRDIETKPDFLTIKCSPLAEVWLKTWRAGVDAGHRKEIVDILATHFRNVDHPDLLPRRTAAATSHAQASRLSALDLNPPHGPPTTRVRPY